MATPAPRTAAQARESLLVAALKRLLAGREQALMGNRKASIATQQEADDALAFAALAYVRAMDKLPTEAQPRGWADSRRIA